MKRNKERRRGIGRAVLSAVLIAFVSFAMVSSPYSASAFDVSPLGIVKSGLGGLSSVASAVGPALFGKILNSTGNRDIAEYFGLNTNLNLRELKEQVKEIKDVLGDMSQQMDDLQKKLVSVGVDLKSWDTLAAFKDSYGGLAVENEYSMDTLDTFVSALDEGTIDRDEYDERVTEEMEAIYDEGDYLSEVLKMGKAIMGEGTSLVSPSKAFYQNKMQVDGITRDELKQEYLNFCTALYQDYVMSVMLCNGSMTYLAEQQGGNSRYEIQIDSLSQQAQQVSAYLYEEFGNLFPNDQIDSNEGLSKNGIASGMTSDDYVVTYTSGKPSLQSKADATKNGDLALSDYTIIMSVGDATGVKVFNSGSQVLPAFVESDNEKVAIADKFGGVFATGVGSCNITYRHNGAEKKLHVEVMNLSDDAMVVTSVTGEVKDITSDQGSAAYSLQDLVDEAVANADLADGEIDSSLFEWESFDENSITIDGTSVKKVGNSAGYGLVVGTRQVRYDTKYKSYYEIEKIVLPFYIEYPSSESVESIYDYDDLMLAFAKIGGISGDRTFTFKDDLAADSPYGKVCNEGKLRVAIDMTGNGTKKIEGRYHSIDLMGTPLFGTLQTATVSELNVTSSATMDSGAIANELMQPAAIENCSINVNIVANRQYVGGAVNVSNGRIDGVNFYGTITNSFSTDEIITSRESKRHLPGTVLPHDIRDNNVDWWEGNHITSQANTGTGGVVGRQDVHAMRSDGKWARVSDAWGVFNCYGAGSVASVTNSGGIVGLAIGEWDNDQKNNTWDFNDSPWTGGGIDAAYVPVYASVSAGSVIANGRDGVAGGIVGYAVCAEINGASSTAAVKAQGAGVDGSQNGRASGVAGVYLPMQYGNMEMMDWGDGYAYDKQKLANAIVNSSQIVAITQPSDTGFHERTQSAFFYDPNKQIGTAGVSQDDLRNEVEGQLCLLSSSSDTPGTVWEIWERIYKNLSNLKSITKAEFKENNDPDVNNGWPVFTTTRVPSSGDGSGGSGNVATFNETYEYGEEVIPTESRNLIKIEFAGEDGVYGSAQPTDVGRYSVRATFIDGLTKVFEIKVVAKTVEFANPAVTEIEFNGNLRTMRAPYVANALPGDDITVTIEGNQGVDVGTYTLRVTGFSGADAANYAMPEGGYTMEWKIINENQIASEILIVDALGNPVDSKTMYYNLDSGKTLEIQADPLKLGAIPEEATAQDLYVVIKDQNGLNYFLKEGESVKWEYEGDGAGLGKPDASGVVKLDAVSKGNGYLWVKLGALEKSVIISIEEIDKITNIVCTGEVDPVYTETAYDLTTIPLKAYDGASREYELTAQQLEGIQWEVKSYAVEGAVTINGSKLLVNEVPNEPNAAQIILAGTLPAAQAHSDSDVSLESYITLPVLEKSKVTSIEVAKKDPDSDIRLFPTYQNEIGLHLSVKCLDQYGQEIAPSDLTWKSSNESVLAIVSNAFLNPVTDGTAEVYVTAGGVESNRVSIVVKSQSQLTSLQILNAPDSLAWDEEIPLSSFTVKYLDQFNDEMKPGFGSLFWSVSNNGTSARISGSVLMTGSSSGAITLTAEKNANVSASVQIKIGPDVSGITVTPQSLNSSGGNVVATLAGEHLSAGITLGAFEQGATGGQPAATAKTTLVDGTCSATLAIPANDSQDAKTYTVKASLDGGATWLEGVTANVTVSAKATDTVIDGVTVDKASLENSGGDVVVTLGGDNLRAGITIGLIDGEGNAKKTAATAMSGGACTATLSVPANEETSAVTYAVKVSLDGGANWLDEPAATVTVAAKSTGGDSGGGTGGGGGGGGGATEEPGDSTTVTNPDGSTTVTVENEDGSKTATTTAKDGTSTVVETDSNGKVTSVDATVSVDAAKTGSVTLPMDALDQTSSTNAPVITVDVPATVSADNPVDVTIPVTKDKGADTVDPGLVVVLLDEGRETVLPKTAVDKTGVTIELTGDAKIMVVDRGSDFDDVRETDWFALEVVPFATARGIINGVATGDGTREFRGNQETNRAMFVGMLHNLELAPMASCDSSFEDVAGSDWYALAANWGSEFGIVEGYGDGSVFAGTDPVTREQMAVFLMRYAEYLGLDTKSRAEIDFPDGGEVSGWAREAMSWAVAEGLFTGSGATGELNPTAGATRAEVGAVLMRFINSVLY